MSMMNINLRVARLTCCRSVWDPVLRSPLGRLQSRRAATNYSQSHPKYIKEKIVSPGQLQEKSDETKDQNDYVLFHPVYTRNDLESVDVSHRNPVGIRDSIALLLIKLMRFGFDWLTNYSDVVGTMTERQWLNRIVFLETVAGVPGFVAGMARHMKSLRSLQRDGGWIHTLLEEAENERMHLLTFLKLKNPSYPFRAAVLLTQGVFFNAYFFCYLLSPRTCHRFVGYLEESAVHTYTLCLKDIEHGRIKHWATIPAPEIAKFYWRLDENATVKEVVEVVRADEAGTSLCIELYQNYFPDHRNTNHMLADLQPNDPNPKP